MIPFYIDSALNAKKSTQIDPFFSDWDRTKAIAASASNTWGLFVLVLMLGYGLVEVPRNCWNRSQKGFQVSY